MTLPKDPSDVTWTAEEVEKLDDKQLFLQSAPWDNVDFFQLAVTCDEIRANPYDLLLVLYRESFAIPSAAKMVGKKKDVYGIVGMNQFTQEAVIGTFFPEMVESPGVYKDKAAAFKRWQEFAAAYVGMTPGEQLSYIEDYFKNTPVYKKGKPFTDAVMLYAANFGSGRSEFTDPNYVFYAGPPKPATCFTIVDGNKVMTDAGKDPAYNLYCQNEGMDVNGDRKITRSDLGLFLQKVVRQSPLRYYALRYRLKRYLDGIPTKVIAPGF